MVHVSPKNSKCKLNIFEGSNLSHTDLGTQERWVQNYLLSRAWFKHTHTQSLQLDFMLNLGHMLILFNCKNFPEYSLVFTTLWMTLSFKLLLLISDFQVLSEISGWFKISAQEM